MVYKIQKFHQHIYGRNFTLITDHHPLMVILGPKKGFPPLAAAYLQKWSLLLSAYQYTIKFFCTQDHANADGLSRLPVKGAQPIGNSPMQKCSMLLKCKSYLSQLTNYKQLPGKIQFRAKYSDSPDMSDQTACQKYSSPTGVGDWNFQWRVSV